ncbi:MAG: LptA/OstA family protein [Planctomycetota bacterium]
MQRSLAFAVACLMTALGLAGEAEKPKDEPKEQLERLEVWAERIIYQAGKGRFEFTGTVTVLKSDMRVDCERMVGVADAKTRRITQISAVGNVRMQTFGQVQRPEGDERPKLKAVPEDAWRATCGRADYDVDTDRLVMTGESEQGRPRLSRGDGFGEADKITFYPSKGEYTLEGSPRIHGRMQAGPVTPPGQ